ncbi:hypothetical protein [Halobacterium jilantaiense]|uniref:Uncharacterized protein n=1 Tax=Halobacterium jilantaiense TaxID=355548 RepID=A0A1I0P739_9EURY|nr:hypothetical protein [Halobacterium jilantaiense]SEW10052.1 hypothetical protein SAMN04487945_1447 [Halobacterium jilantaiense]
MTWTQVVMAISAVITALSALGALSYTRQAARDARWSRRALEGEQHSDGLIECVEENEQRSRANERALRRVDLRTDGGHCDD